VFQDPAKRGFLFFTIQSATMKKLTFLHTALVVALYVSGTLCALSQDWNQILKTTNPHRDIPSFAGRSSNDQFGNAVAIDGNYAVVAASLEDHDALGGNKLEDAGSVWLFYKNLAGNWIQLKKLVAPDRSYKDRFGISVAISGNTIVVGSDNSGQKGAAYIYSRHAGYMENWGFVKKIVPPIQVSGTQFGISVAISGNTIVVGANQESNNANESDPLWLAGAAYLFQKDFGGEDNWGFDKKIVATDRHEGARFGSSISLSNGLLAVGAPSEEWDTEGANKLSFAGAVYLFDKNQGGAGNWGQVKKLVAADRGISDRFGSTVAISDSLLVVGVPYDGDDANGLNPLLLAGSAYLFGKNAGGPGMWGQIKKIVAPNRAANDNFGYSVAQNGLTVAVGALYADDATAGTPIIDCGVMYIFSKDQDGANQWGLVKMALDPQREYADRFGTAIAMSGSTILVSAIQENQDPNGGNLVINAGSAFILEQNTGGPDQWGDQQKITLKDYVPDQNFGSSIAMDGDYTVIGCVNDFSDAGGQNHAKDAGAVWIFKNINGQWTPIKKLIAPYRNDYDRFGYSVAINGSTIAVGAPEQKLDGSGANPVFQAGAAYIFSKDAGGTENWGIVRKLVVNDRKYGDYFGSSVAISGGNLVVGAYGEDEDANGANTIETAGAAYLFSKDAGGANNWGLVKKIAPADRAYEDLFGDAAAMEGNYMIIGASASDHYNINAGAAYLYGKDQGGVNNWGLIKKLVAPLGAVNDRFATSMGISGTNIVIGVRNDDEDAGESNYKMNAGSAYIFGKDVGGANNWGIVKKITATDRGQLAFFGRSVAISGNIIVAGAVGESKNASGTNPLYDAGSAYIYEKDLGGINNWGFVKKIVASDRAVNDVFGNPVAISGSTIAIAAIQDDEDAKGQHGIAEAGSVYFFKGGCGSFTMSAGSGSVVGEQGNAQTSYFNNNCSVVASITPSGNNPITGSTSASVWVETIQPAYYVLRHYEITPAINPATSTGRVTLYFTQPEFDGFNAINDLKLPTGPSDAAGKANLLIEKRTGISSDSTGKPDSYTGTIETMNPADHDIVWNAGQNRWEVSFDVTGFSGFFVKTTEHVLPLRWISFTGILNVHRQVELTWKVDEKQTKGYTIEKSVDGHLFMPIGLHPGRGDGQHTYRFSEEATLRGEAYYRIRQTDKPGNFSLSPVLFMKNTVTGAIAIYPNPFSNRLMVSLSNTSENHFLQIFDAQGRALRQVRLTGQTQSLDLSGLPDGLYLMRFGNGQVIKVVKGQPF
jgi:hypothetical protein